MTPEQLQAEEEVRGYTTPFENNVILSFSDFPKSALHFELLTCKDDNTNVHSLMIFYFLTQYLHQITEIKNILNLK